MEFSLRYETYPMLLVGVGGGGCNVVNRLHQQGIKEINLAVCDTSLSALNSRAVSRKIQLGPNVASGIGAGSLPSVGQLAANESEQELQKLFEPAYKIVFIVVGLGGGTGTGAVPMMANIAKQSGALTVAIATLPFDFEGRKRMRDAEEGFAKLKANCDTLILIKNDKLRALGAKLTLREAFAKVDEVAGVAVRCVLDIVQYHGVINVDINDVITIMRNGGLALIGIGVAKGDNRAVIAMQQALQSPLLDNQLAGTNNVLINVSGSEESLSLDEVHDMTEYLYHEIGTLNNIIWGYVADVELNDELKVSLVLTGFSE